jgi:hypothetical protein
MSVVNPKDVERRNTVKSFVIALSVNAGLLLVQVGAFVVLKQRLKGSIARERIFLHQSAFSFIIVSL